MKHYLLQLVVLIIVGVTFSCDNKESLIDDDSTYNQWVYIAIESQINKDTSSYFQYGRIQKDLVKRLNNNEISGYFTIKDIRYFNDNDQLEIYEDDFLTSERVFRIKDIAKIQLLKMDPIFYFENKELAPTSLKYLKKNPKKKTNSF